MSQNDQLKYWVAFSRVPGIGRVRMAQLRDRFGDLALAWKASAAELKQAGLDARVTAAIGHLRPMISPDEELEKLARYQVRAVTCEDHDYPSRLKEIYDYPPVLYLRGNGPAQDECSVAIVGTRRATVYGRQVTEEIVRDLVANRVTIVSGLAKGIDSIAHRTALENGGRTVAVSACGLDMVYPAENARLAQSIMEHGLLISEYPIGTRPKADNFPRRNRIMSGISLGVLVVEAGDSSGALITAMQALEQDREVFAIPGSILSPASRGANRLIQRGEAKLVLTGNDILEELNLSIVAQQLEIKEAPVVDKAEAQVLKSLEAEPVHIDEICRRSGLPAATVNSTLTVLELKGMVRQFGGMSFALSREARENRGQDGKKHSGKR